MQFFKEEKKYLPRKLYLKLFLQDYWFAPQDVLLRSLEANVWDKCTFKHPILDIGIGDGGISRFIYYKKGMIDVGIDPDKSGLENAKSLGIYRKVLNDNAQKMSFKDASFNTVLSNSTFEHIADDRKAVAEVSRVLKKGGLFFVTVPSEYLPKWILEFEKNQGEENPKKNLDKFNNRVQHLHYRSFADWQKLFEKNNMNVVLHKYYYPKETVIPWYKLMKLAITKVNNRELWSLVGHSKFTRFLPKKTIISLLQNKILKRPYEKGFFQDDEVGGMLFMVAQKA